MLGTKAQAAARIDAYASRREHAATTFDRNVSAGIAPRRVAEAIERALEVPTPKARCRVGADARMPALARRCLPDALFNRGLRRQF